MSNKKETSWGGVAEWYDQMIETDPDSYQAKVILPNIIRILDPKPGMIVDFSGMRGRIQSVAAGRTRIDFNNPLAGKTLIYDVEVVEKIEGKESQAAAILEFFGVRDATVTIEKDACTVTGKIPEPMRKRFGELITTHVAGVTSVRFVDEYTKTTS